MTLDPPTENPEAGDTAPRGGDLFSIGEFLKPRGLSGEIKTRVLCSGMDHFAQCVAAGKVWVYRPDLPGGVSVSKGGPAAARSRPSAPPRRMNVLSHRVVDGFALVRLEGVDSIDKAEEMRGLLMGLAPDELPPAGEDSWYHHQLEGLQVEDETGNVLGTVLEIEDGLAHDQILVSPATGSRPFRIPLIRNIVLKISLERRNIVVRIPKGLIEAQI
jgi:16S rRNA processing protein RimM